MKSVTTPTTNPDFFVDWSTLVNPKLDEFVNTGVILLDDVFKYDALTALQTESGYVDYQEAHLTHGQRATDIRGDNIRWIDDACPMGQAYLNCIHQLGHFFNQTLFAGIRRAEAHYACYPAGFGYQWHTDNPKGRHERIISAVFYLNQNWTDEDGGAIHVINKQENLTQLAPKLGRLVIFDSNLRHQVQITNRTRFSIATWLRADDDVL